MATKAAPTRTSFAVGPWKGVRDTQDPFDDPGYLVDATNVYLPDPAGASGFYVRPGEMMLNNTFSIASGTTCYGQAVHAHVATDGTVTNLAVIGGIVYRVTGTDYSTWTDVTPVGPVVNGTLQKTVKMLSVAGTLIVSDGVNRPWIATDLGSTPITGTVIQYNAGNDTWAATDMTEFGGAVFYALDNVAGVSRRFEISWTEPGLPDTGLEQTNFDNNWPVVQQGNEPLTALCGTNISLFYFRRSSIGRIQGAVGPDLQSTATHDSAAYNIGTLSRDSIQLYGNTIYFIDAVGRPYSIEAFGASPNPIWYQLRGKIDRTVATVNEAVTALIARSAIEPVRNIYLVGTWTPDVTHQNPPGEMLAFDAATGTYMGAWTTGFPGFGGPDACGTFINDNGARQLVILGTATINPRSVFASALRTGDDTQVWVDGDPRNNLNVFWAIETGRVGFDADTVVIADQVTVIMGGGQSDGNASIMIAWDSSGSSSSLTATANAATSDNMTRYVAEINAQGKSVQISARGFLEAPQGPPTSIQRITVSGRLKRASPWDA